ncbi:MAG: cadherin-like beta sandwich domain-containing protein [Ruminococcus sp.]|nr:cadherin-like beta sandwich domain-containing protein [Ruminococcus sp.]
MKLKKLSKFFAIIALTIIMTVLCSISAFAMGNAEFTIPKNAAAGSNFSVSVKVSADKDIGFVTAMITYDDSIAEFSPSDDASGGDGIINLKGFPDEMSKDLVFKLNFKALKSGTCKMNLTNCFITSPDGDQIGSPTAYANVTITAGGANTNNEPEENNVSSNTDANGQPTQGYLKSLTVSEGVLKPNFSFDIYDYHVDVDEDVEICEIEGETASDTDTIWYTGNENLIVGNNIRTIKVTDKDGNSHVYTITITRAGDPSSEQLTDDSSSESLNAIVYDSSDNDISINDDLSSAQSVIDDENDDALAKYRKILTPALIIILVALIIALVVLVVWLKKKKTEYNQEKETNNKRKK